MNNAPQYDGLASVYASHGFDPEGTDGLVQVWMEKELGDVTGKTIIDAGCGAGRWHEKFIGARSIIGVDVSKSMLQQVPHASKIVDANGVDIPAQVIRARGLLLVHGRMEDVLPRLRDMDLAFASFSLCVCDEPREILQAFTPALKTNGRVLVSTNIFVDDASAPTDREPIREIDMKAPPVIGTYHNGIRKELRIVLHLPGGDLAIADRAHVPSDYMVDSRDFTVSKAHLVKPQGLTFVDGGDEKQNQYYYGDTGGDHVLSIDNTIAKLAHLCLELAKTAVGKHGPNTNCANECLKDYSAFASSPCGHTV